jgi:hypothetical protein
MRPNLNGTLAYAAIDISAASALRIIEFFGLHIDALISGRQPEFFQKGD